jgi:hypothetical protein
MIVVFIEIVDDGLFQLVDAVEDAATDALSGDLGKEAFDHVEAFDRGSLVGGGPSPDWWKPEWRK